MSQTTADRLADLNPVALNPLVRQVLNDLSGEIEQWHCQPIYGGFGGASDVHRIYRLRGSARAAAGRRPWSLILKIIRKVDGDQEPGAWNYWKREALLYPSGLLDDLAPGLAAPRCYGVVDQSDDETWIWLEDVGEEAGEPWPLERFASAAERLGRFNGSYLADRPLPEQPWLNQGDWQIRLQAGERYLADLRAWRGDALSQRALPEKNVEPMMQLWAKRAHLFAILDGAPRCFCHNDAYCRNLLVRRNAAGSAELAVIDWAWAGLSAAGAEAAKLLITSLVYLERPAADMQAMYQVVLDSYVAGLQASGWRGDETAVRRAYAAACVLLLMEHTWLDLMGLHSGMPIELVERYMGHPIGDLCDQHAALTTFVLGVADGLTVD